MRARSLALLSHKWSAFGYLLNRLLYRLTVAQYCAMESSTQDSDPQRSALQQRAIEEAKLAYSRLPHGDAVFRQCLEGKETLVEDLNIVEQKRQSQKKKKSTKFLSKLQKYSTWLQNISAVVDVAVQTQAGFGCPLWAPIKFILKVNTPLQR